ncbi:MAG TPA: endonuclease domain-containing protein [Bacteroidota bacterium]|nr:endonuclease domain-containing protein [Bacteroidota bacterium]
MTRIYNRHRDLEKRRRLRRNMPKAEAILWSKLRNRRMHGERFLRQYGVDQYVLDFYCPRLKLAIEVDGDSHCDPRAMQYDKRRQEHIESYGIHFLRFANHDVCGKLDGVCQDIFEAIEKNLRTTVTSHFSPESGI